MNKENIKENSLSKEELKKRKKDLKMRKLKIGLRALYDTIFYLIIWLIVFFFGTFGFWIIDFHLENKPVKFSDFPFQKIWEKTLTVWYSYWWLYVLNFFIFVGPFLERKWRKYPDYELLEKGEE